MPHETPDSPSGPVSAAKILTDGHAPDGPGTLRTAQVRADAAPAPGRVPALPKELEARFETIAVLGQGGAGVVLRARDRLVGREVAIKLLLEGLEQHPKLLQGEATHLAQLEHERIVRLYDFGLTDGGAYLVMELVRGETLWRRLARGRPALLEALAVGVDTCDGMAAAHARGLVHADLKPMNLFLDPDNRVKIADFGLARTVDTTESAAPRGTIQGTPGYLAPEQADGHAPTPAADVYAIGVVLAEMLGGQRLFTGRTPLSILAAQARGPQWKPSDVNPGVPPGLDELVMRCLAKDASARPPVAELARELRGWQERLLRAARVPAAAGFPAHPYKLLDHFESEDAVIFFGRESEVAELAGMVTADAVRMALVFGPCGAGKSSLLRAGLARSLASGPHECVVLTSGADPVRRLAEALEERLRHAGTNGGSAPAAVSGGTAIERVGASLRQLAKATGKTPVVILDQLEEVFTLNPAGAPEAAALFELVSQLVEDERAPVKLVLSFRTEFRGRFFEMERRLARFAQSYQVSEMREQALAAAIEGPTAIESYRFGYEPGFAQALARDLMATVAARGDSPAPVLQIVCRQLYDRARAANEPVIGAALYERALGGARGALSRWVEERLRGSGYGSHGSLARQMLRALTVKNGAERFGHARDEQDLLDFPDRDAARRVLDQLLADRLVVREDGGKSGRTLRLASEVICPLIDEWAADVDEAERAARLLGRTARQWAENGRRAEDLLTGGALTLVERQLTALRSLSKEERTLVDASRAGRRRKRASAGFVGLTVAAVLTAAAWATFLRPGTVQVVSDPPGAAVTGPAGEKLGVTPLTWVARPGVYQLGVAKDRYAAQALTVRVPAGGEATYAPVLAYPYGVLALAADPPGATCAVYPASGGPAVLTTTTPFHAELPSGQYKVRLTAPHCLVKEEGGIEIPGNRMLVDHVTRLERDTGQLEVRTPRAGTALTVRDAQNAVLWTATLPLAPRELPSGRYRLEVHAPDHQSQLLDAEVKRGQLTTMSAYPAPMRTLFQHPLPMMGMLANGCPDLDGDGTPDVVVMSGELLNQLITVNGKTGKRMMTATVDVTPSAGAGVAGISLADVDGDGRVEAIANFRDGQVSAFDLKDAHRLWQLPGERAETPQLCCKPVLVDVDGDRTPDVVMVAGPKLRACSGRDGHVLWETGAPPRVTRLDLAQLDGVGLPELVLGAAVGVLGCVDLASGKPLWGVRNDSQDPNQEVHLAHADLDGDGTDEVLAASPTGVAAIDGRSGKPRWAALAKEPFAVAGGHLRHGAPADVIAAFDEQLAMYDGRTGKPVWTVPGGSWFDDPVITDLDHDGLGDVIVKRKEEVLEAYRGSDGMLLWRLTGCSHQHNVTPVADFNGDGIPDTVRVSPDRNLTVTLGAGADAPWTFKVPGELVSTPPLVDLNGDGELDAVIGSNEAGCSAVAAVTPRTGRQLWRVTMAANAWPASYLGDLDGDGKPDVVAVNRAGEVRAIQGATGKVLWMKTGLQITAGASLHDLNGDGRVDVICRALHPAQAPMHQLSAFNGPDGKLLWTSPAVDPALTMPGRVVKGFQRGKDVVTLLAPQSGLAGNASPRARLVLLDGRTGLVRMELPFPVDAQPNMSMTLGDLDGDDKPELVLCTPGVALEVLSIAKGQRLWSITPPGVPTFDGGEDQLALADLDGDGKYDVIYASTHGETGAFSGLTGKPLWLRKVVPPPYTRLTVAALDGDDLPDLLFGDFEGTVSALSGKTGAPIALGLRSSLQTCALVVDPTRPGPFTEAAVRQGVPRGKPARDARISYTTPDGTLVLTPLRALGLR